VLVEQLNNDRFDFFQISVTIPPEYLDAFVDDDAT